MKGKIKSEVKNNDSAKQNADQYNLKITYNVRSLERANVINLSLLNVGLDKAIRINQTPYFYMCTASKNILASSLKRELKYIDSLAKNDGSEFFIWSIEEIQLSEGQIKNDE